MWQPASERLQVGRQRRCASTGQPWGSAVIRRASQTRQCAWLTARYGFFQQRKLVSYKINKQTNKRDLADFCSQLVPSSFIHVTQADVHQTVRLLRCVPVPIHANPRIFKLYSSPFHPVSRGAGPAAATPNLLFYQEDVAYSRFPL